MKSGVIFILFFVLILFYFPNIKGDVISVNNGGVVNNRSTELVIGDNYIEGFFSKQTPGSCSPMNCSLFGYNCGNFSDGCSGTLNCGTCSSDSTCNNGICVLSNVTNVTNVTIPPGPIGPSGGGVTPSYTPGINITPSEINLTLSYNNVTNMSQRITEKIYITNHGDSAKTLSISQNNLDFITIITTNSITVNPNETKEVDIDFVAPLKNEDINGKIFIDGYSIPVSIHVTSNPLWFDSNIVILNKDYQVSRGGNLKISVELIS
jgi:hypothetical protein